MTDRFTHCQNCGAPLPPGHSKYCDLPDCQRQTSRAAKAKRRANFRPGGAQGWRGRPVTHVVIVRDNELWPVGRVFAAAAVKEDIRAGRIPAECAQPYYFPQGKSHHKQQGAE